MDVHMRRQKWRWFGHSLRKDEKCIARKAMEPFNQCRKATCQAREAWRRTVARDSKIICKSWNDLKALAHNRACWKTGVIDSHGIEDKKKKKIYYTKC